MLKNRYYELLSLVLDTIKLKDFILLFDKREITITFSRKIT